MEIKPEEVHLFSGDELLQYLTQLNFFDTSYLDNIPDDINWFVTPQLCTEACNDKL
jgi:hypothetical protein